MHIYFVITSADIMFLMLLGKEYDLQSTAQKPDATTFVSSASGTKVGTFETFHIKNLHET